MVAPWEVDQLPDEWMLAFDALSEDLPRASEGMRQLDEAFERAKERVSGGKFVRG